MFPLETSSYLSRVSPTESGAMSILRAFTLLLLVLGAMTSLPAQELSLDTKFTFTAPPEVEIKLRKSSKTAKVRGVLTSLSKLEAVVSNEKGEQRVSFDRIDTLKTALVEFTGDDDYLEIGKKVRMAYSSVEISGSTNPVTAAAGHGAPSISPDSNPIKPDMKPEQSPKNSLGQGGFGGIKNVVKPKAAEPTETTPDAAGTPEQSGQASSTETMLDATEVYICDKCKKEITSAHLQAGQCPHCKTDFAVALTAPRPNPAPNPFGAAAPPPVGGNNNPFGAANKAGAGQAAPPVQGGPIAAPPAVIQGGSNGFTLDSIPNWAKGGLFVLLVLVGYHVVFNR